MKKIFEKARKRIIRKLGGYVVEPMNVADLVEVAQYQRKYVSLSAEYHKYGERDKLFDNEKIQDWVRKELAYRLAEKNARGRSHNFLLLH